MPKARSSDRSLGLAHPLSESYTNTSSSVSRCRLHSAPQTSTSCREKHDLPLQEDKGLKEEREREREKRAVRIGLGKGRRNSSARREGRLSLSRYLNLRLPRGRAQKCKAIVSWLDPMAIGSGNGNVSKYMRQKRSGPALPSILPEARVTPR